MSNVNTYPLRLPTSVKAAAEKLAREDGVSLNQFVATAIAEKLAATRRRFSRNGRSGPIWRHSGPS
ncbi:HicB family protein [Methylomagnum ishizawai]|uniref:HicB family protein n=1 Tax=Methylomagnum ishizawai TaxID=1760988 RepID=A0A1Y6D5H6_9GAMM|nr:YlcI/YnfO family protein [Methylomagnum ishizawai]SMF96113.1 HicB family protein [Methylomagnum ishizawai]